MADTDYPSRAEFTMLANRVDSMDREGTRGVLALQQSLTDTIHDIADLKVDMATFKNDTAAHFNKLTQERENERRERISGRRWMVGIGIAALGSLGGVYGFLAVILEHVH
jgi:hypothetical protein